MTEFILSLRNIFLYLNDRLLCSLLLLIPLMPTGYFFARQRVPDLSR